MDVREFIILYALNIVLAIYRRFAKLIEVYSTSSLLMA